MFANALRGIGWAAMSAAGYSMLALSAPPQRRGEASGYYSGVQASGTILLPAVALWLIAAPFGGFRVVFTVAFALAAIGAVAAFALKRHISAARARSPRRAHGSLVAGNLERARPRDHSRLGPVVHLPCHLSGGGEFFSALRARTGYRQHRLVLCRQRRHQYPGAAVARQSLRPHRPRPRPARLLHPGNHRPGDARFRRPICSL